MISFVSHGDKTLQRLVGMLGEQEHHISSVPFFFITLCVQRSWTTLAGVSPVTVIASEPCS